MTTAAHPVAPSSWHEHPGRQNYFSGRLSSAKGAACQVGVSRAVPVTSGSHHEMLRRPARKGQQYKCHRCDTGYSSEKKALEAPCLIGSLEAFGRKKYKLIALSQYSPVRSLALWVKSTFCHTAMAEASAGGSAQCAFQRQLHSVLAAFWLSALGFNRAAGQCSYSVFHGASTLGKWVTSIPALSHGGNQQQPEGLGGRGQIATANEVRLDIHCSCLHPKRVRQDWEGSVYTLPACNKG